MTKPDKGIALLNVYKDVYQDLYGKPPVFNRHALKWAARDIVEDYGLERAIEVGRFFFGEARNPDLINVLFSRFAEYEAELARVESDREQRSQQRQKMYEAMREEGYDSEK